MSQDIHYVEGDDYLDAVPAADGVILRMSDNAAVTLRSVLEQLARLLEHGELPQTRQAVLRLRRPPSPDELLEQMFPDAYPDRALAAGFRQRHGAALRAQALVATQRLLTHWDGAAHIYLGRREVDDWLVAGGLAQFLFVTRTRRLVLRGAAAKQSALTLAWLQFLLDCLALAVCPSLPAVVAAELGVEL